MGRSQESFQKKEVQNRKQKKKKDKEKKYKITLDLACMMGSMMGGKHKDQINESARIYQELTGEVIKGYPFGKKKKWYQF